MHKYLFIASFLLFSKVSFASLDSLIKPQVRFSPTMIANLLTQEKSYVKLTYGQPYKKGRVIFGNLVPFNELWRLGANEATELTVNKDFEIGEKVLNAGSYTLFAVPKEDVWTIIVNKKLGQWGIFEYDESQNVHLFDIPVSMNKDIYEGFTIELEERNTNVISISFLWDKVITKTNIKLVEKAIAMPTTRETRKQRKKRLKESKP